VTTDYDKIENAIARYQQIAHGHGKDAAFYEATHQLTAIVIWLAANYSTRGVVAFLKQAASIIEQGGRLPLPLYHVQRHAPEQTRRDNSQWGKTTTGNARTSRDWPHSQRRIATMRSPPPSPTIC
jgi:hypothetical protein